MFPNISLLNLLPCITANFFPLKLFCFLLTVGQGFGKWRFTLYIFWQYNDMT